VVIVATVIALPPSSDLRAEIRRAIAAIGAANVALDDAGDDVDRAAYRARIAAGIRQLEKLERKLPVIPETLPDLTLLAEIAEAWLDKDANGQALALDRRRAGPDLHIATRVVLGVLALAGTERRAR
jgi:hypothetical protein